MLRARHHREDLLKTGSPLPFFSCPLHPFLYPLADLTPAVFPAAACVQQPSDGCVASPPLSLSPRFLSALAVWPPGYEAGSPPLVYCRKQNGTRPKATPQHMGASVVKKAEQLVENGKSTLLTWRSLWPELLLPLRHISPVRGPSPPARSGCNGSRLEAAESAV